MSELKSCPFCGSEAKLVRMRGGYKSRPTTILDTWAVQCTNLDCDAYVYSDSIIYQNDDGEVIVEANGAELAISKWNDREGE